MITERHDVACRLIMKAIIKGFLAGCLVQLNAGSTNRSTQQDLQITEHASNTVIGYTPGRSIPSWRFGACLSARDILTSCHPDAILVTSYQLIKPNHQPLLICTRCHTQDNPAEMYAEFTSSILL